MPSSALIQVQVQHKTRLADDIVGLQLQATDGSALPAFSAGAHIDLHLPNGQIRQYSLANDPQVSAFYELGILLDPTSRGGSCCVHQDIQAGDQLHISQPRNLFALVPAPRYRLFAGGIGITPILSMAHQLYAQGAEFELHYCARSRSRAAYVERLQAAAFAERVHLYFDDEPASARMDAAALLATPDQSHVYICGPSGFIRHLTSTAAQQGWSSEQVHYEQFAAPTRSSDNSASDNSASDNSSSDRAFEIQLVSSGQVISVAANESAADALTRAGVAVALSCEQGICGSCLLPIVDGEPDHRDYFQTQTERAANSHFTPCCSRAKSRRLVINR
ncbi:PDR/VanB family oxidoreductase [Parathalassolituus penaei]|uniref:PDR/VanB family oxidoreductase n=1 Tax=Parathalassolituus penaei TaxID=2997323 RepID=A0A9X3EBT3_9GAMM|nr:PDR/VanB family oxidoreductase [Parathalassolituus penaei]MCY0964697.1 PDR/VanB family oxidoreductase [Parathalassolituus penaei]